MFKLFIVDDFKIERESVKEIIAESGLELEVCGEYSNGRDALIALEKELPDFIITDVEMPFMDGLEFGEKVRQRYPQIKVILFSFHSKFEYAKKAIDLEAYAYILKPIIEEELIDAFKEMIEERKVVMQKLHEDSELKKMLQMSRPLLIDNFKRNLFVGLYKDPDEIVQQIEFLKLDRLGALCIALTVEADDYHHKMSGKSSEEKEMYALRISMQLGQLAENTPSCLWVRMDDCHWAVMVHSEQEDEEELKTMAYTLSANLIRQLEEINISVSIGISTVTRHITCLSDMYEQAINALEYKFKLGKGQMIRYEDIQADFGSYNITFNEVQKEIAAILNTRDRDKAEFFVDKIFSRIESYASEGETKNLCISIILYIQIVLNNMNINLDSVFDKEQLLWERLMKFEIISDVKSWLNNIFYTIIEYMETSHNHQYGRIIEGAIHYIKKNYNNKITVKSIADELMYSTNYLNNVFKQKTGETILEYITKIRVEEAKRLIENDPNIKMYELAEAVGYNHESYFRNIFKQYTGFTPKEYKDSL